MSPHPFCLPHHRFRSGPETLCVFAHTRELLHLRCCHRGRGPTEECKDPLAGATRNPGPRESGIRNGSQMMILEWDVVK